MNVALLKYHSCKDTLISEKSKKLHSLYTCITRAPIIHAEGDADKTQEYSLYTQGVRYRCTHIELAIQVLVCSSSTSIDVVHEAGTAGGSRV